MKRLDENMSRPVIETAADGTVTLSAHHRIGERKSKKDQQKWAEGIAAAVAAFRRETGNQAEEGSVATSRAPTHSNLDQ